MVAQPREIVYHRPALYPKQEAALFHNARYGYVEASTKSGKTVGCIAWLLEQAFHAPKRGANYWWVAPVFIQARIAYDRTKNGLTPGTFKANDTDLTITLAGVGSIIWFKSGEHPDSLFGEDVYAAVVDEASRVREEAWFALRSTLTATRGPVRFIGNVKGRKNWFYRDARKAEAGEPNTFYAKITAYDAVQAGVLDAQEIEDAKRTLPDNVFRELYLAEPSADEGNPFGGTDAIQACIAPLTRGPATSWGWDLAKSVDWTVGIGLDRDGHACEFRRFQISWEDTFDRVIGATGRASALVDSTGVGDPILERFQKRGTNFEGYHFTPQSKQQLMEGLSVAIQQRKVTFPAGPVVSELESFEYEYTRNGVRYTAPSGAHDDCVCALALAVRCAERKPAPSGRIVVMPRTA